MSKAQPKYLLDTNVFIEPKNRFYPFDFCPAYWEFLEQDFRSKGWTSIQPVYDEVTAGKDELKSWFSTYIKRRDLIDCAKDQRVVDCYNQQIYVYVMSEYASNLVNDFFKPTSADPWLVSQALIHGGIVVTGETPKKKTEKVSLFDVCDHFGVRHTTVFEFIRDEKAVFDLRK